jgi:hypothetical protein
MKKPSSSIGDDDRVREIAKLCYEACDEAVAIIEFLEAGNTPEAEAAFEPGSGHIPILVRKAMKQRLLMSIMRMYDNPGSDRETLPRAFELLGEPTVYQAVCVRGDKLRLDAAIARRKLMQSDPALAEMRTVRDYELAHTIPSKAGKARPRIMDFFCVARQTITLTEELAAGGGIVSVSWDHARGIWAERATAYWARLIATPVSSLSS